MPSSHVCGVPGCENKGTLRLPPVGPLRNEWYCLLNLSTTSQSHRICPIHFDPLDLSKSGRKRRHVKPTRNLPLNSVSLKQPTQFFLSYLSILTKLFLSDLFLISTNILTSISVLFF